MATNIDARAEGAGGITGAICAMAITLIWLSALIQVTWAAVRFFSGGDSLLLAIGGVASAIAGALLSATPADRKPRYGQFSLLGKIAFTIALVWLAGSTAGLLVLAAEHSLVDGWPYTVGACVGLFFYMSLIAMHPGASER